MFASLFQTASGSWHIQSILIASGWLITGILLLIQLSANRTERLRSFEKEQQNLSELKDARAKIATLEEKTKLVPFKDRLKKFLIAVDPKFVNALKAGRTTFNVGVNEYELTELKKLSTEKEAPEYIQLRRTMDVELGYATHVEMVLSSKLIK